MKCFYHPDRDAVNTCPECGQATCSDCNFITEIPTICRNCWHKRGSGSKADVSGRSVESSKSERKVNTKKWEEQTAKVTKEQKTMGGLSKLAKVSDSFSTHIEGHILEKNEWMPCPRCGESTVDPPTGGLFGGIAGFSLIGCWTVIIAVGAIILGIIFWPIAVVFVIIGLILIPFLPILGAGLGMLYRCKSCGYNWTFKDAENYKEISVDTKHLLD